MGPFNSYELFIIPRLDSFIRKSGFSNSKYSLFVFLISYVFGERSTARSDQV